MGDLKTKLDALSAKIAAGLTDAQKEALLRNGRGYFSANTIAALNRRGLMLRGECTPLGQQVAAILRENENG